MNYFIDFEATQFSNEIISIGCVREDGETFYSLVKPKKKLTNFIINLTGITQEMIDSAPNSDEVFEKFFNWLCQSEVDACFLCYGNSDLGFVKKNLENSTNLKAQSALSLIGMNLHDYSKTVETHFGLVQHIALKKIVAYYRGVDEVEQTHNALEDALFLKEIYDNIQKEDIVVKCPFPEYANIINNSLKEQEIFPVEQRIRVNYNDYSDNKYQICLCGGKKGGIVRITFTSLDAAINWIIDYNKMYNPIRENIARNILKANNMNKKYCGKYWRIKEA